MDASAQRPPTKGDVFRVVSGNFLEMFDFMVYGFYAAAVAKAVFPNDNEYVSLMLSLATFGIGFLMRPLGAIVLGAYIDRHGRRAGLVLSLAIMSVAVALIAFTPTYASIGIAAPVLVLIGRLLQGFSAGAESGGVSVYLSEIATPGNRGFYVSWQSASQQVAVIVAAIIGVTLRGVLTEAQMLAWGWRIPFLIGCLIIPVLFWIRRSMHESEDFAKRARHRRATLGEIDRSLLQNWAIVLKAVLLVTLTEIMPAEVRATGFSLADSLAQAIFGGFTPAVCTYLIHATGNRAIPGLWLACAALFSIVGALTLYRNAHISRRGAAVTLA